MQIKYRLLMLSLMMLSIAAAQAEVALGAQVCQPTQSTRPRINTPTVPREVNVVCGANTITQNFVASQPAVTAAVPAAVAPARVGDSSPTATIALISGAAGVFGALIGALAGFGTAWLKARSDRELETKRLKANLIAAERLRWLQDIRQRLSTLFQQLDMQYNVLKRPANPQNQVATQQRHDEFSTTVMAEANMIALMLNPRKPDQEALRNAVNASQFFMLSVFQQASSGALSFDDQQYAALKNAAFDAMTRVGVQTWKQVKELE